MSRAKMTNLTNYLLKGGGRLGQEVRKWQNAGRRFEKSKERVAQRRPEGGERRAAVATGIKSKGEIELIVNLEQERGSGEERGTGPGAHSISSRGCGG